MLVAVLVIIGIIIKATANDSTEFRIRFDDKCKNLASCDFSIYVRENVPGPVYVYIHFENFFLNHRRVMRSVSKDQLRGLKVEDSKIETACSGKTKNKDIGVTSYTFNPTAAVNADGPLNPCGIYASLYPKGRLRMTIDILKISTLDDNGAVTGDLVLDTTNINYKNLRGNKYKITDDTKNELWTNVEDPRFIEWMKPPMSSSFYKLWGVINGELKKGNYKLTVTIGKLP